VKLWKRLLPSREVVPPVMSILLPLGVTTVPVLSLAGTICCAWASPAVRTRVRVVARQVYLTALKGFLDVVTSVLSLNILEFC